MTRAEYEATIKLIAKEEVDNSFQRAYEFGSGYLVTGNERLLSYIRTLERTIELLSRQTQFDDEVNQIDIKVGPDGTTLRKLQEEKYDRERGRKYDME